MAKTAIGLFEASATADRLVAHLMASGFARDEIKLVKASDFDGTPSSESDILKLGGLPAAHAGRYWNAVRNGRVLVAVTSAGNTADRAAEIMNQEGAIYIDERRAPVDGGTRAAAANDPGFFPQKQAAQLFEIS